MGYTEDDEMVRVDFFKESGKWYTTEAINFPWSGEGLIHDQFRDAVENGIEGRLRGMIAVCLEPNHPAPFPLMIRL